MFRPVHFSERLRNRLLVSLFAISVASLVIATAIGASGADATATVSAAGPVPASDTPAPAAASAPVTTPPAPVDTTTVPLAAAPPAPAPEPVAAPAPAPAPAPAAWPPPAPAPAPAPASSPRDYARAAVAFYGWGGSQFGCLDSLWNRESGWSTTAKNRSSGAYGIPQALPGAKMASAGPDWQNNHETQIKWGLDYIKGRYGSPCGAWGHSQSTGWY